MYIIKLNNELNNKIFLFSHINLKNKFNLKLNSFINIFNYHYYSLQYFLQKHFVYYY